MTPTQYDLIQKVFEHIIPIKTEFGWAQFEKIAEFAPESVFDTEMRWRASIALIEKLTTNEVSSKLMVPITNSGAMGKLPGLTNVTKAYSELGITAQQIPVIKRSFIWCAKYFFDNNFDSEMEEAMTQAFDLVEQALEAMVLEETASQHLS